MTCSLVTGSEEDASVRIRDVMVKEDNGGTGNIIDGGCLYQHMPSLLDTCKYKTHASFLCWNFRRVN